MGEAAYIYCEAHSLLSTYLCYILIGSHIGIGNDEIIDVEVSKKHGKYDHATHVYESSSRESILFDASFFD